MLPTVSPDLGIALLLGLVGRLAFLDSKDLRLPSPSHVVAEWLDSL